MDHQAALNRKAAEQYLLGELTSSEKEAFEAHLLNCQDCTEALQEHEMLAANARAVFAEEAHNANGAAAANQPWPDRIKDWLGFRTLIPIMAMAALALFFITRQPAATGSAATSEWTLQGESRGDAAHHGIDASTEWLAPGIDLVPGMTPNRWVAYQWRIENRAGAVIDHGEGANGSGTLRLRVAAAKYKSGDSYRLIVQGDPSTRPLTSTFVIDRN